MKGIRLFDRFGFNLPKQKDESESKIQVNSLLDYEVFSYISGIHDWVNVDTEEGFSNFKPTKELEYLLAYKINTTLE